MTLEEIILWGATGTGLVVIAYGAFVLFCFLMFLLGRQL